MTTNFWQVPPIGTPVIQIDIEAEALGRNYPLEIGVLADAKAALEQMLAVTDAATAARRERWVARAAAEVETWRHGALAMLESSAIPIRPERICHELTHLLPPDALVLADTGHAGMWMGSMFDVMHSRQFYLRSAGHLGWAFPAGLGAKCACPDRPVVTFTGDSGLLYHIAELETAVRAKINAVTVVNNNRSGNQAVRGFDRAYGGRQSPKATELWMFNPLDFARIAEDMGAVGFGLRIPQISERQSSVLSRQSVRWS